MAAPKRTVRMTGTSGSPGKARDDVVRPRKTSGGGIDIPKFAGEVSRNYAKGVAQVGKALNRAPGVGQTRKKSSVVTRTSAQSPKNRAALKRALGK